MAISDSDYEGPAIKTLGSLFKVTQIFLWDDGLQAPPSADRSNLPQPDDDSHPVPDSSDLILPDDLELTRQMNELGLPVSFQTTKEKCGPAKGKKKGARAKHPRTCSNPVDETLNEAGAEEVASPAKFHDKTTSSSTCISMLGQSESSYCDGTVEADMIQCVSGEEDNSTSCTGFANDVSREKSNNLNDSETNDANNSNYLNRNGIEYREMDNECVELSPIVCKNTGCETICNDDGASTWRPPASESELLPSSPKGMECDRLDLSNNYGQLGDWMVFWDTFYMRRYFYNVKTQSSTWDPPPGMEHLAFGECTEPDDSEALKSAEEHETQSRTKPPEETLVEENLSGKQHDECSAKIGVAPSSLVSDIARNSEDQSHHHSDENLARNNCNDGVSCCSVSNTLDHDISSNERCIQAASEVDCTPPENMVIDTPGSDTKSDPSMSKQGEKVKRRRGRKKFYYETEDSQLDKMTESYSMSIGKYWCQRYILFSKFDDGVKMDEEGWFSVTPEVIARHQASRCATGVIIDCFTGVGGNAIQFAQWCRHVIAVDIDPLKIDYARHNAAVYGVDNQIDFIIGDFFLLAPKLKKADIVFLSPPWGGPEYIKATTYDLKTMLQPHDGFTLFNVAKKIASRVVMFLPRNVNFNQLAELSLSASPPWSLEVEKVYLNRRLKAVTAYFSDASVGGCRLT